MCEENKKCIKSFWPENLKGREMIKMDVGVIGSEGVDWRELDQYRLKW
jgi:hypothetical protein